MAFNDDQKEYLPGDGKRRSSAHLPRYFRTTPNEKFLSSTLDQFMQPGVAEKLSGYYGRKTAKSFKIDDNYVGDVSAARENYQLEPACVIKDTLDNVTFYKDYNDFMNQLTSFSGATTDHSIVNKQEFYSWDPHIDWDKFANFREYYWLPNGPQTIEVAGQSVEVESTYTISLADNADNNAYLFSPDGKTQNPTLKLYRGITYRFDISTPGLPFTIRTKRTLDDEFLLDGIVQNIEEGTIEFTLGLEVPDVLYYVADNDINVAGLIKVANIEEATFLDVETEVLGKQDYTTAQGFSFSNGMKIRFIGDVIPASYAEGSFYVEGVGDKIELIPESDLTVSSEFTQDVSVEFDALDEGFDRLPFDEASGYPVVKDYIVINRASKDGNLWSRYNRWFHRDVVEQSAKLNNQPIDINQDQRAKRPIIEFEKGLKLYKFGTKTKKDVDLIDTFTKDAFSNIEGAQGYNIDGVNLTDGMRVLFTADPDPLVKGNIYEVKFINFSDGTGRVSNRQISLVDVTDKLPVKNETVLVKNGNENKGLTFYFNGDNWITAQNKTKVNQPPLFDIFDENGISYSDSTVYESTNFLGNKVFSYSEGTGANDAELGFPLKYKSIENVGDITFTFDLNTSSFQYQINNQNLNKNTDIGFLRKYSDIDTFTPINGWTTTNEQSSQVVLKQFVYDETNDIVEIDVYDNSNDIADLWLRVFKNNVLMFEGTDYSIEEGTNGYRIINFTEELVYGDNIIIKTKSKTPKNENGFYEINSGLERNPENKNLVEFTLGQISDHVGTIVEQIDNFAGVFPGKGNLRDKSNLSAYGRRFVKHSIPVNLGIFGITDETSNIVFALRYARKEYGKFKRRFLQIAEELGYEGPVKEHVDRIMLEMNKDKVSSMPFYFSDMVPTGAVKVNRFEIFDEQQQFFATTEKFDLKTLGRKAVQVYLNELQLVHGKDYTFNDDGFIVVTATKQVDDVITVYEYESTNGSFVPPTPTKLGLYPKFQPVKYLDTTASTPLNVIQGHDGSIIVAYDDYRDNLLLELEKRIFNNIKQDYDPSFLNIHDFIGSEFRVTDFTKSQIENAMLPDFVEYQRNVRSDYTTNNFSRTNSFTFNYSNMTNSKGESLPGYWRDVYKQAFDTDRPHTHPWEMLGYSIQPDWWEEQYGPAPYTKDNLPLWEDLEKGVIRDPNTKFVIAKKYIRTGLTSHIPVDSSGNLLSPNDSGYAQGFNAAYIKEDWVYGDGGPVETAWKRSSEYPFSLITSWLINQPHNLLSKAFDMSRQKRNIAGQIIYNETKNHLKLSEIVFPNSINDTTQVYTSGIVNYVSNYISANVVAPYSEYKSHVKNITNQIGFKIGGFTDKSKFKLVLDSRTPLNQGNVFIPEENYKVILNQSSPIKTISYSGVIIERLSSGYKLYGYDNTTPSFKYYKPVALENDPVINVGGISESYVEWDSGKTYVAGQNLEYNGAYYRVKTGFVSGQTFDIENLAKLASLPLIGGREGVLRRTFRKQELLLPYGTVLKTVQDVVDFLLGYGEYLKDEGFVFDYYNAQESVVSDWYTSAKEFLFWTTQNWNAGSAITLSPSAYNLKFVSEYSIVDNIFDSFYGYTLLKADGEKLIAEFATLGRQENNEFVLSTKNTEDGIFAVKLPLVQKEHVVLLDNTTEFNDTIYDPQPGYRQERIKVLGYRTDDWDGSINIPGFIYDDAKVSLWTEWTDYAIGDIVKYKEFFYTANQKVAGSSEFDSTQWSILNERPESKLIPNFEYKTNQFADFYDLDSDNFDVEQQKFAQHLIGYQNRTYLANIINDDVSQYKFYQGFIQDKGTKNALTKLFDALASDDKDSLEFFEEWAIKQGQYGAADGFDEVEFQLDESSFRLSPQPILLTNTVTNQETDLIYRIQEYQVYGKPDNYDHSPFPAKKVDKEYTRSAGYVNQEDINHIVSTYDDILSLDFTTVENENYIWVGNEKTSWNVYKHLPSNIEIESVEKGTDEFTVVLNTNIDTLSKGQIVGLYDLITTDIEPDDSAYETVTQTEANIGSFYKIKNILLNRVTLEDPNGKVTEDITRVSGKVSILESVRAENLESLNTLSEKLATASSLFWLDADESNAWRVLQNQKAFEEQNIIATDETAQDIEYGFEIAVNEANNTIAVGVPGGSGNGKVYVYRRSSSNINWSLAQIVEAPENIADTQRFGESLALSPDGTYLVVGSPNASNVKTLFKDNFEPTVDYDKGNIVSYQESLWEAQEDILGSEASIQFSSFDSLEQINVSAETVDEDLDILIIGNAPLTGVATDHFLVKAPLDMYEGTKVGDTVYVKYNDKSIAHNEQSDFYNRVSILGDEYPTLSIYDSGFLLNGPIQIVKKVDVMLYLFAFTSKPSIGDRVETSNAFGTVNYVFEDDGRLVVYLENINGVFSPEDSLFLANGEFVGEYSRTAPSSTQVGDTSSQLGGYWYFNLGTTDIVTDRQFDEVPGLVIYDVLTEGEPDTDRYYYNSLDYRDPTEISSEDTFNSYLRILSFQGFPGADGTNNPILSSKYVLRAPADFTDSVSVGDSFDLHFPTTQRVRNNVDGALVPVGPDNDPTPINLDYSILNKRQLIDDIWDGYIFFEFTKFERSGGQPNEPRVGDICRDVTTGASAEIVYYQRDGINVTLFVKNIQDGVVDADAGFSGGPWSLGDDYGDNAEIKIDSVPDDPDVFYQAEEGRVMGQIQFRGFPKPDQGIGKLIVLDSGDDIAVPLNPENGNPALTFVKDLEYWFSDENQINGIARLANIPSEDNNDWSKVFNIPAIALGSSSGLTSEGMYSAYIARGGSSFNYISSYTVPTRADNARLGNKIELTKFNDLYRLFVHAGSDQNDLTNPGRIYFVKQGIEADGSTWNWDYAKDKTFKGNFDNLQKYYTGDKVYLDGFIYESKTNLDAGAFDTDDWTRVTQPTDYVGYIPNDTALRPIFDSDTEGVDLSTILDQGSLLNFGNTYSVSKNGEVIAVSTIYGNDKPNAVVIYRSLNGNYQRHQTIFADDNTTGFGHSVALSDDGDYLAVGAPFNDDVKLDQGVVYLYKLENQSFVEKQRLRSRKNEKIEQFGWSLGFSGDDLAIGSRNADALKETTFDSNETILDNNFTKFAKDYENTGVVYFYRKIDSKFIFGQTVDFDKDNLFNFGKNLKLENDHLYVPLPEYSNTAGKIGTVVDYKKSKETIVTKHLQKDSVDVEKIKKVFLYDKAKKELVTYLDYVDPIQGKIAGIAEQELRYKLHYDPAHYTNGDDTVTVDPNNGWQKEQVGQLWWDLSTAKFINPYQDDVTFSTNNWNKLFVGNTIDVYEWVETTMTPSQWSAMVDTEQGISKGVSGTPKYGDNIYSTKRVYDNVAGTFSTKYYYWVKNKKTLPDSENRTLSADNVSRVISDPAGYGLKFIAFISPDSFVPFNCESLIKDKDIVLSVQYWTLENQEINIHNQYQILTDGLESSLPSPDVERKWFDSLIGRDDRGRPVPSLNLNDKQKYGILNNPRQSWFKNNIEAFNQLITRTNSVLKDNLIIDDKDISNLSINDPQPGAQTRIYDQKVDSVADLEFVGVARAERAVITPVIVDGKIKRLTITNPGRGYRVSPTYSITGTGSGAEFEFVLNNVGAIIEANVIEEGQDYTDATRIEVRRFTVLVENDATIQGKWALYERIVETRKWSRTISQSFDVSLFWEYIDWYASGYSETTEIDYLIQEAYELQSLPDSTGDVIKIQNVGTGGWLLLEKITAEDTIDYTLNYKTIGREKGTIKFLETLYDPTANLSGFDNVSFDTQFFDPIPTVEARIILETIRDKLFVDELAIEYNKLFFASLRYVFAEQNFVDWAFKTSFVKAKHNTGQLEQKVTFQNDNLPSYEEYLKEVKPFKTKLREYLSNYEKLDNSNSMVSDFDLPPKYSDEYKQILPQNLKVINDTITGVTTDLAEYPFKNWADNNSYSIASIDIADGGSGYTNAPTITITGGGGSGATAKTVLGNNGSIAKVVVTNPGSGYISQPALEINGSLTENGRHAKLGLKLSPGVVRNLHSIVKFDRLSGKFVITKLSETETFTGTGAQYTFNLTYPMDLRTNTISVVVDNTILLSSEYSFENVKDDTKGYDRYKGRILFTTPPANNKSIVVTYKKPVEYLEAQDRINLFYEPTTGQLANDIGQLMDGIDYGGVEVKSFDFGGLTGWDAQPWYTDNYDSYDTSYEDEVFTLDGSTISVELAKPLESGIVYNVYRNGVRLDDPNYDTPQQTNTNAIMQSVTGDGVTTTFNLANYDIPTADGDVIIIRKSTSDGSFIPDTNEFDVQYSGGDLAYNTASGLNAEDITIDGDGFVTPTTSKGPEELVPGQLVDTVDIKVFEGPIEGSSQIHSRNYIGDGSTTVYDLNFELLSTNQIIVKIDNDIQNNDSYEINFVDNNIKFTTAPASNARINLLMLGIAGSEILEIDDFVADGSTANFVTNIRYNSNLNAVVSANGKLLEFDIQEARAIDGNEGNVLIALAEPAKTGEKVSYAIFQGQTPTDVNYSLVTTDTFRGDGSTTAFELEQTPFNTGPNEYQVIVKVNDNILNAGYSQLFNVTSTREYTLDVDQVQIGTLNSQNILVYLNGEKIEFIRQWTFSGADAFDPNLDAQFQPGNTVKLAQGVGAPGDELRIYILSDGDYRFGYYETDDDSTNSFVSTPGIIHLDAVYTDNDTITVYQFSNHDKQDIVRTQKEVVTRTVLSLGSDLYYKNRQLRNGYIALDKPAVATQYVWITINGTLLDPNGGYRLLPNKRTVQIIQELQENDVIQIIHFSNSPVITQYGWRQFKDMLNRTHYKVMPADEIVLVNNLNYYDRSIEVSDASKLPTPSSDGKYPGIIEIGKERIEYLRKDGNVLKQLRRGTMGTGTPDIHVQGSTVVNQNRNTTVPYKDELLTTIFTGDGTSDTFSLDFTASSVNEFEVFVAGKRLRKNAIQSYRFEYTDDNGNVISSIDQDSPEGDITLPAEFTLDENVITLANPPQENVKVIVIRKIGKLWSNAGERLVDTENEITNFITSVSVELPR